MEEILRLASELGERIAAGERFRKLIAAEEAVRADAVAGDLLAKWEAQRRAISDLEAAGKPVEPEEKHKLQLLNDEIHASAALRDLTRAQADYMEMMNRVNEAIRKALLVASQRSSAAG